MLRGVFLRLRAELTDAVGSAGERGVLSPLPPPLRPMPAALLVALYEYSPLFYISVVFVCFLVTSGLVMGWFGWDVPVILRNSEESESRAKVSFKQMQQVKNPFSLEILNPATASAASGISLSLDCLEDCLLTCYWGCSVQKLHEALQKHAYCFRIKTPRAFEDTLHNEYLYRQQYHINKADKEPKCCRLPEEAHVADLGPVPRSRYPLVVLLTLADEGNREIYDIISMISIIHVPDDSYRLSCRILYQYLLLAQGQFHDLKQLFMSANASGAELSSPPFTESTEDRVLLERARLGEDEDEAEASDETSKDCVVCQNRAVNWVLLPCRHTCLCDECVRYFQQCPMCRQFVRESFPLRSQEEGDGERWIEAH